MLSVNEIKDLMDIKEVPSNLSQDKIRIVFNENFRKIRKLIEEMRLEAQTNISVIRNLNIIFPTSPDPRLQYVLKYNDDINKWMVVKFLGTQNVFEDGEAVEVGNKHQHIVHEVLSLGEGSEVILNSNSELVVLENTASIIVGYKIADPPEQMQMPYEYIYDGIHYSETLETPTVYKNGLIDEVNIGDVILPTDYVIFSVGNSEDIDKKVYVKISKVG